MALGSKRLTVFVAAIALGVIALAASLHAGGLLTRNRSVGGVTVDATGFIRAATIDETAELTNLLRTALDAPRGDLAEPCELRMISLKGLQQAILESRRSGGPLPESVSLLAGLQRIEYVFVDEAKRDIVLAGPAEPWKLREDGAIVGTLTGGATLRLDDLIVALRSVESARRESISCSIEPTAEGRQRLHQLLSRVRLRPGQNPQALEPAMREAFGPQQVLLSGVPTDSRYAMTLVAADYQMKRVAMALTESPVRGLPSYLAMARNVRHTARENPRWWMECDYESLSRTPDGSAWKLTGRGVKTLTEQDVIGEDGKASGSGRQDTLASKWADLMTEHYDALSKEMPIFRELRNLMDLTVVSTLIVQERLADRADLDMAVLMEDEDAVELASYPTPQSVEPHCSFVRGQAGVIATASGGVSVNAFQVVQDQQTTDPRVAQVRDRALAGASRDGWYWSL